MGKSNFGKWGEKSDRPACWLSAHSRIFGIEIGAHLVVTLNPFRSPSQKEGRAVLRAMTLAGLLAMSAMPTWATPTWADDPKATKPDEVCTGEFGTSLRFEKSPSEAARKALKGEKLVVVIHVSGDFEDPAFT
jgi:hypothetical protein